MTISPAKLSRLFVILAAGAPALFGVNRVVSNAGVIVGCRAQYTTIAAAIAAANPNDTVLVCNTGVPFNEQVTISKSITLSGQSGATIQPNPIAANTTDLYDGSAIAAAVLVTPGTTGVTISDLIIDGSQNQIAGCAPQLIGVYFQNASGTIVHTAVTNFALGSGLQGCQTGLAIYAETDNAGGLSHVTAVENSVRGFQKNGITANFTGATLIAESNVVTGWGPTPYNAQNGIQIAFGATGTITGNTVSGEVYTPCIDPENCTYSATGISIYDPSGTIATKSNHIDDTQGAIYYQGESGGDIASNTISNTLVFDGIDIYPDTGLPGTGNTVTLNTIMNSSESGMYVDTDSNTITDNKIVDTPIGIWLADTNNTPAGNKIYAAAIEIQEGTPPQAGARRGKMKPQPFR
jgi:parallel beta-helix repeat protein